MTLLEPQARGLLILHGVLGALLVGAATHHLLWCRGYLTGRAVRADAERRFAVIASLAFVATFGLGGLLYPTYKVRVRAAYFDAPTAVAAAIAARSVEASRFGRPLPPLGPRDLAAVGRLFDIKEHGAALGLAASLTLLWLSRRAHPRHEPRAAPLYVGLSLVVAASAWSGALVGLYAVSLRAVGGPQ